MQHIGIKYIDTARSTIRVLKDYRGMVWKIENSKGKAQDMRERMTSPKTAGMSSAPVSGGSSRTEDRWAQCIDKMDLIERGLLDAQEYMAWFSPAWAQLEDEERLILCERFMTEHAGRGEWADVICRRTSYAKPTVYLKSEEALNALAGLLFW